MALESKRSVFLSASLSQSRDRSVLQRFGATERPTAICKLAPSSSVVRRRERRELRRLKRETPLLISKEMKLIKQIVSTAAAGRATTPPLLSRLPPTEMAALCTPRAKWKTTPESGCRMRHLPFRSKSLALVCQQLQRGKARIDCETPQFVHGTQLRGIFTLAPIPRGENRNRGIVNRHHAKKQGVLKPFTRRLAHSLAPWAARNSH